MPGIMTHVGLLENSSLSEGARSSYIDEVAFLLENGTNDFLFSSLPEDLKFEGNKELADSFKRDSLQEHQSTYPRYHQTWLDELYQQTATQFDIDCGAGSLKPAIIDPTVLFPDLKLKANVTLGDLLVPPTPALANIFELDADAALKFVTDLPINLAAKVALPIPTPPPPPQLPTVEIPSVDIQTPDVTLETQVKFNASLKVPPMTVPPNVDIQLPNPYLLFFSCVMIIGIPLIIVQLIAQGLQFPIALADSFPIGIIVSVFGIVLAAVGACIGIKLSGQALTFVASFLVFLKKLTLMLIVLICGLLLGQGLISKLAASGIGLV
jgi:hypothetical protein